MKKRERERVRGGKRKVERGKSDRERKSPSLPSARMRVRGREGEREKTRRENSSR